MSYPSKLKKITTVPPKYELTLNKYQRDNLKWLLSLHRVMTAINVDYALCDTGDWLCQIYDMLGDEPFDSNVSREMLKEQIISIRTTT